MELPGSQSREPGYDEDRGEIEGDERREPPAGQGLCNASCGDIGIMFWSM